MSNPDVEYALDMIYKDYLRYAGKTAKKKHHPSRQEYGEIIKHAQLWNIAIKEAQKQIRGGDGNIPER